MSDKFNRNSHAVFARDFAHFLKASDSGFMNFAARDFVKADGRDGDDGLATDFLSPFAHLLEFVFNALPTFLRTIVEEAKRIECKWLNVMRLEEFGKLFD